MTRRVRFLVGDAGAAAMRSGGLRSVMVGPGYTIDTTAGHAFRKFIADDAARWTRVIREANRQIQQ
jgi:hypothetical protein